MNAGGITAPTGSIGLQKFRKDGSSSAVPAKELTWREIFKHGFPRFGLPMAVFLWRLKNIPHLLRGLWRVGVARFFNISNVYGAISLVKIGPDGQQIDYGLASLRVITTAGVTYLAADMAGGGSDINLFKFHGFGTGATAEASGDTALVTELTTQYATDSTRPTGSQSSSTNTYTTVATLSPDTGGTLAITEHGVFSANASGTLWDRSVFSAVNLVAGSDSLQVTYVATFSAGG